jgi:hypothetical protein
MSSLEDQLNEDFAPGWRPQPDPPESLNANGTFAPGYGTLPPGTQAFAPQEPPLPGSSDDKIPF